MKINNASTRMDRRTNPETTHPETTHCSRYGLEVQSARSIALRCTSKYMYLPAIYISGKERAGCEDSEAIVIRVDAVTAAEKVRMAIVPCRDESSSCSGNSNDKHSMKNDTSTA